MRMRRQGALVLGAIAALVGAVGCEPGQPGTPDTGFGDGGTVVLDGPAGSVSAAPAADGGVVVVRGDGELVKVAADGAVVAGWGGPTPVPCAERDEVDRDGRGRYLVTCMSTAEDGTRATALVRYTARGRLDRGFGNGGVVRLAGEVEGAAAVPLPGGRVLALGGRPDVAGQPPVLVTTVLDARGRVVSTGERDLEVVEGVPAEFRASTAVTVVAEPLAGGAVAAVHASTLLTITDIFRPTDPFLLVFGRDGGEVARLDGPPLPNGNAAAESFVVSMAEVAPGRIAVLEDWWELIDGPRPAAREDEQVRIYRLDGTEEHRFTPVAPGTAEEPGSQPFTSRTLAVTGAGRHLLVGGVWATDTWHGGVTRYAIASWAPDPGFGTGGMADVGPLDVRDLDARGDDPAQLDATGPNAIPAGPDTPAAITRLWNSPLGSPAPAAP
jgi:hypothetical protein